MRPNGRVTGPIGVPNGEVGVPDLIELLSHWGDCDGDPAVSCWADLDFNGTVGVSDLLALLASWGICPGNCSEPSGLTFEQQLSHWGTSQSRWDEFLDVLTNEPRTEQDRWLCWFERYLNGCTQCRTCRGTDPFKK